MNIFTWFFKLFIWLKKTENNWKRGQGCPIFKITESEKRIRFNKRRLFQQHRYENWREHLNVDWRQTTTEEEEKKRIKFWWQNKQRFLLSVVQSKYLSCSNLEVGYDDDDDDKQTNERMLPNMQIQSLTLFHPQGSILQNDFCSCRWSNVTKGF